MPPNQAMDPTKGRGNASATAQRLGCAALGGSSPMRRVSVIARLEGARATKIEGRQLEAGHERLTRRVPHVA
jgi:hypothetical protein